MSLGVRRFYVQVTVEPREDGFAVCLDGKELKTPAAQPLRLPARELAELVAADWARQCGKIETRTMYAMQVAAMAIDRVATRREAVIDEIAAYGVHDLLCYRASDPPTLVKRQHRTWQPLLDWARDELAAPLVVTEGVMHRDQSPASVESLRRAVAAQSDLALAALHRVVTLSGSLVLGLALVRGRLDSEAAIEAAFLDEHYQLDSWGRDAEAEARLRAIADEIRMAARFLAAVAGSHG